MSAGRVRPALAGDLAYLPAIESSAARLFEGTGLLDGLESTFSPPGAWESALAAGTLWVAEGADGSLAGFLAAEAIGRFLHVQEIDVALEFQRRGLGRSLMQAAIAWAQARGRNAVTLTTFRDVAWNAPFYASMGFGIAEDPPPHLAAILAAEARLGLDPAARCGMVLPLAPDAAPNAATLLVRAGARAEKLARTVGPPIQKGSTVLLPRAADLYSEDRPTYGRAGLATQEALASALCELEGARSVRLFPSGLAAMTGAMLAVVHAGDEILVSDSIYMPTRRFCDRFLARLGVTTRYYPPAADAEAVMAIAGPTARLVVLESPGSLSFEIQDVSAIAAAAKARGLLTLIDNTWAAGLLFKPLAHGADISVQALTKYVGGHSDVFMGSAAAADPQTCAALDDAILEFGWAVSPEDSYQMLRGLRTLALRLDRHGASALEVAGWLAGQSQVARVLFPALPGTPGHDLWKRDYTGAAGLFSIVLKPCPGAAVHAFLDALKLFGLGFSWGGFESLAIDCGPQFERRAFPPFFEGPVVRLNIGLEAPGDLIADLRAGLDMLAARRPAR